MLQWNVLLYMMSAVVGTVNINLMLSSSCWDAILRNSGADFKNILLRYIVYQGTLQDFILTKKFEISIHGWLLKGIFV